MPDPRTFQCPAKNINETDTARGFFKQLGKLGSLDIASGNKVAQGFKLLENISDSIRTGTGALPSAVGSSIDSGANWVLNNTVGQGVIDALKPFNPGVVNSATSQAQTIFLKVKSGNFKNSSDIPGYLQDFQNLERLASGIYTPGTANAAQTVSCVISPYAMDLFALAPKQKFLFIVELIASDGYSANGTAANLIYKFQLPQLDFDYEEVNMYNFRTRVIKNIKYNPVSITLYDDGLNSAMIFFKQYINVMSPLSNVASFDAAPEESGMNFSEVETFSANAGAPAFGGKSVLKQINLYHVYEYGLYMNQYSFFNPRFTDIKFDDLSMENSDVSNITATFVYDGIHFDLFENIADEKNRSKITELSQIGQYPLRYVSTTSAAIGGTPTITPPSAAGGLGSLASSALTTAKKIF